MNSWCDASFVISWSVSGIILVALSIFVSIDTRWLFDKIKRYGPFVLPRLLYQSRLISLKESIHYHIDESDDI